MIKLYKLFSVVAALFLFSGSIYAGTKNNSVIAHFSKLLSLQELNDVVINHGIEPSELYFHDGDTYLVVIG